MKTVMILGAVMAAILCGGCATIDDSAYKLQLLSARVDALENRVLELDRDVVYLLDERIKQIEDHVNTIDNERK